MYVKSQSRREGERLLLVHYHHVLIFSTTYLLGFIVYRFMVACDQCGTWYHGDCIDVTEDIIQSMNKKDDPFVCQQCKKPGTVINISHKSTETLVYIKVFINIVMITLAGVKIWEN